METIFCKYRTLDTAQKSTAARQMKNYLAGYTSESVPLDDVRKAMLKLDIPVDTHTSSYVFKNEDVERVYRTVVGK